MLVEQSEALRAELAKVRNELAGVLVPLIDDQLFYAMTGYRNLGEAAAPRSQHFSEKEFERYRHLSALQADVTIAIQLLSSAFNLSDAPLIEPLRERFEAAEGRIERSLSALGTARARSQVAPTCVRLFQLGLGERGGFDLRTRELETRRAAAGSARTQSVSRPQSGRRGRRAGKHSPHERAGSHPRFLTGDKHRAQSSVGFERDQHYWRVVDRLFVRGDGCCCAVSKSYRIGCAAWPMAIWRARSRSTDATKWQTWPRRLKSFVATPLRCSA